MNAKLYLLAAFVLCIVVGLVSPVVAPAGAPTFIKFEGTITQGGSACIGDKVEIEKCDTLNWVSLGTDITDTNGKYDIPSTDYYGATYENDTYRLTINDGEYVTEKEIKDNDWVCTFVPPQQMPPQPPMWQCVYQWDIDFNPIPEFSTITIPVVGILGLLFFFSYRKRRKEEYTKEKDK